MSYISSLMTYFLWLSITSSLHKIFFLGLLHKGYALFPQLFTCMRKYIIGYDTQVRQNMVISEFKCLCLILYILSLYKFLQISFFCFVLRILVLLCVCITFFIPYSLDRFIFYLTYNIKLILSKLRRKTTTCVIIWGEIKSFTLVCLIFITSVSHTKIKLKAWTSQSSPLRSQSHWTLKPKFDWQIKHVVSLNGKLPYNETN